MAEAKTADTDISVLVDDIQSLKKDFAKLVNHVQRDAKNAAGQMADTLSDGAQGLYTTVADQGKRSAKALSAQVEEQPLLSIAIAFGIGFLGGRFLAR
jgi:ElaB/YqjD/DUF883 family membrane-anchored ribosome-binding protein